MKRIELKHVEVMPQQLQAGILYVSREFGTAQHLCACGCGSKVRTPLSPAEWRLEETPQGPTLTPSIGNWQRPCRSHYWIWRGTIRWAGQWSDAQIAHGRKRDQQRLQAHLERGNSKRPKGVWNSLMGWLGMRG